MRLPESVARLSRRRRPVLRVQLALLYSGVFVGLVVILFLASSVLFGTANVFFGHSQQAFRPGLAASSVHGAGSRQFEAGPFVIALLTIAAALGVAWWLAGRFLRPLREMTLAAQEISVTNLDRRLVLNGPEDELTGLGRTLNDLLGRLQSSFAAQRQFVANASHELRTPLAGQRTLLQVALADPDADVAALRSVCEEALRLGDQQARLVEALLTLAVSERGVERWESFDLQALTETVLQARHGEIQRRGVRITATLDPARTTGDEPLVESLVGNLVDNAIRYNVAGGLVQITTSSTTDGVQLSISNTGPDVPEADIPRLFAPFQRSGPSRVDQSDGHGLGLAVVQAIATAHGAALIARPHQGGGLDVQVTFKAAREIQPSVDHG